MCRLRIVIVIAVAVVLLLNGCAGLHNQQPSQPRTLYSTTDSTALVYTDPAAAAPVDDLIFWRWAAMILYPFGLVLDYALNRPFYKLASHSPGFHGYTAEDEQLDRLRPVLKSVER